MLKFLRKYNKWLLVVFGSFLMVSFLAPQAIQQIGQQQLGRTTAVVDGREISVGERQRIAGEHAALGQFFDQLEQLGIGTQLRPAIGANEEHWLLLSHAAEAGGYVGGPTNGANWALETFVQPMAQAFFQIDEQRRRFGQEVPERSFEQYVELSEAQLLQMMRIAGSAIVMGGPDAFETALAKLQGVLGMLDAYAGANRVSRPRTLRDAQRLLDQVVVDVALIPAGLGVGPNAPEPSEADLVEHFLQYRDTRSDQSEDGVGYRQPPRVKLEWLVLDPESIARGTRVNDVEVRAELKRNRAEYPEDEQEALELIRSRTRTAQAERLVAQARSLIRGDVQKSLEGLRRVGQFYEVPAGWEPMRMAAIAEDVQRTLGIALPEVTVRDREWLTRSGLSQLPGIGTAAVRVGAEAMGFPEAALSVREIAEAAGLEMPLALQVRVPATSAEAVDARGRIYFFTILDARGESPADRMDEIREQVVQGYNALRGLETLREQQSVILETVKIDGLDALKGLYDPAEDAEDAAERGEVLIADNLRVDRERVQASPVARDFMASGLAQVLDVEAFRDAVFAAAGAIDPTAEPESIAESARWFTVAIPQRRFMAVVKVEAVRPLTQERYRTEWGPGRAQQARIEEIGQLVEQTRVGRRQAVVLSGAFSPERLAARLNYRDLDERGDEVEPAGEAGGGEG